MVKSKKLLLGLPEGFDVDDIDSDCSDESENGKTSGCSHSEETNESHSCGKCEVPQRPRAGEGNKNDGRSKPGLQCKDKQNNEKPTTAPSQHVLERCEQLQRRVHAVTERSRLKRIKDLQKEIMHKVANEFPNDEDRDILHSHDVKFGPPVDQPTNRKRKSTAAEGKSQEDDGDREWQEVRQYIGVNSHLAVLSHGRLAPQSGLESQIAEAATAGNVEEAEKLSDHLATRELGQKIVEAIDAKRYIEAKKKEQKLPSKRKKLNWTFSEKQRWETKGNM